MLFVVQSRAEDWLPETMSVGNTTKMQSRVKPIPMVSNIPMLAIPRCGDTARLPKLQIVVNAL